MTFVVAEPCIKRKYTDCVAVCPVDCFHEGANYLVIDPGECIDCGACEYIALNAKLAEEWPVITEKREPLPDAESLKEKENKRGELVFAPGP